MAGGAPARRRAAQPHRGPRRRGRRPAGVAGAAGLRALDRGDLARGVRRPGRRRPAPLHRAGGAGPGPGPRAGRAHRHQPGRADAAGPRNAGAEGPLAAEDPGRRRAVVPALLRARGGVRPRRGGDEGRTGRRRVGAHRAEGLDQLRPVRRLGALPRPHRSRGREEPGHLRLRGRHAGRGRRGPAPGPDHGRGRVQRGLLRRRLRPRRPPDRRRERRLAGLLVDAHPRAGDEPSPVRHPRPAGRGTVPPRRRDGPLRRRPPPAEAGRGLRRGPPLPAPQLALALAPGRREGARPRGQHAQALLERDEQAPARDRDGRAGRRRTAVAGGRRQPRRRRVATVVALLPRRLRVRRDERDPAQHHRRARPRPPPEPRP